MLAGLEGPEEGLLGANEAVDEEVEAGVEDEEEMGDGRGNVHPPRETGQQVKGKHFIKGSIADRLRSRLVNCYNWICN